jgi:hypothetical protein
MERAEPGDSHPIINEWGETWVVPGQARAVRAVSEPEHGQIEHNIKFLKVPNLP